MRVAAMGTDLQHRSPSSGARLPNPPEVHFREQLKSGEPAAAGDDGVGVFPLRLHDEVVDEPVSGDG